MRRPSSEVMERDMKRLDDISARTGEHFGEYIILVKNSGGMVSWRASDSAWCDGAARQFSQYVKTVKHMQTIEDFNWR